MTRLCVNCKHHALRFEKYTPADNLHMCHRLKKGASAIDLVTGDAIVPSYLILQCREERENGECGRDGRFFKDIQININCSGCRSGITREEFDRLLRSRVCL